MDVETIYSEPSEPSGWSGSGPGLPPVAGLGMLWETLFFGPNIGDTHTPHSFLIYEPRRVPISIITTHFSSLSQDVRLRGFQIIVPPTRWQKAPPAQPDSMFFILSPAHYIIFYFLLKIVLS